MYVFTVQGMYGAGVYGLNVTYNGTQIQVTLHIGNMLPCHLENIRNRVCAARLHFFLAAKHLQANPGAADTTYSAAGCCNLLSVYCGSDDSVSTYCKLLCDLSDAPLDHTTDR